MKVVALVSGGKDSCYNMMECVRHGHEIVALANLHPPVGTPDEMDSFMFQTVGHQLIEYIAQAMDLPLFREALTGRSVHTALNYTGTAEGADRDEIEDLEMLLRKVKEAHPEITAVSCGAILSNYQRSRVEHVCGRLGLTSLCFMWQRDQVELLKEICQSGLEAVLVKIAMPGLTAVHLTQSLSSLAPLLLRLRDQCDVNVCGEGGEYETLTLDCPLFKRRLVVEEWAKEGDLISTMAPVAHATPLRITLVDKTPEQCTLITQLPCPAPREPMPVEAGASWVDTAIASQRVTLTDTTVNSNKVSTWQPRAAAAVQFHSSTAPAVLAGLSSEATAATQDLSQLLPALLPAHSRPAYVNLIIPDMAQFGPVNALYVKSVPPVGPPARACVQGYPVTTPTGDQLAVAADMVSFRVPDATATAETEGKVAVCPPHSYLHVQSVSAWAPANIGPYAQGWEVAGVALFAGQIGLLPGHMDFPSAAADEVVQSFLNALHGIDGLGCTRKALTSCALYVGANSLVSPAFARAVQQAAERYGVSCPDLATLSDATAPEEERMVVAGGVLRALEGLCPAILSSEVALTEDELEYGVDRDEDTKYPAENQWMCTLASRGLPPLVHRAVVENHFPALAPVSVLVVPVLPRLSHTEVQVIALTDAALRRAEDVGGVRHARWAYRGVVAVPGEGEVQWGVVISGTYVAQKFADITAHVFVPATVSAAALAAVFVAADGHVQALLLSCQCTYDYTAEGAKYAPTQCTLTGHQVDKAVPVDIMRARVAFDHTMSSATVANALQVVNSPFSQASLVPVLTMQPNAVAAQREAARYVEVVKRKGGQVDAVMNGEPMGKPASEGKISRSSTTSIDDVITAIAADLACTTLGGEPMSSVVPTELRCVATFQLVAASVERLTCDDENDDVDVIYS